MLFGGSIYLFFFLLFSEQVSAQQSAPPTVVVNAFLWDGSVYKPFGKLGLTFMLKDDKAMLVLFKSKQQMISMVDLSQEPLKVEQHSSNIIVVLDSQGRAWSLQMFDENFIKTFPYHLLSMRYSIIKNRKNVSFLIDKGETWEYKGGYHVCAAEIKKKSKQH